SVAPWHGVFPFFGEVALPHPPSGHAPPEGGYGILTNTPVTLFAAALPLGWSRLRSQFALRWFVASAGWILATSLLVIGCFYGTVERYEFEFAPLLVVLACLG